MAGWIVYDADGLTLSIPPIAVLIIGLFALIYVLSRRLPSRNGGRDLRELKRLIRVNYVGLVFGFAALIIGWALWIGLWQVPSQVSALIEALEESVHDNDREQTRSIIVALAAVLGGIAIIGTVVFQSIRVWINERTAKTAEGHLRTAEENLTTGLINKAVEGLGAEKSVSVF